MEFYLGIYDILGLLSKISDTDTMQIKHVVGQFYLWYSDRNQEVKQLRFPQFFNNKRRQLASKDDPSVNINMYKQKTLSQMDKQLEEQEQKLQQAIARSNRLVREHLGYEDTFSTTHQNFLNQTLSSEEMECTFNEQREIVLPHIVN